MNYCPECSSTMLQIESRYQCSSNTCNYVFWNNPIPVVAAIVECPNGVILANSKQWDNNALGLITGFIEHNESPDDAVLREVEEELGVKAELVSLIGVYPFKPFNQVIIGYHLTTEKEDFTLSDELSFIKVIPKEKLQPWDFGSGYIVRDFLK